MKSISSLAALTVVCFVLSFAMPAGSAEPLPAPDEVRREAEKQQRHQHHPQMGEVLETQTVCAGQIPFGWIRVNDSWNPSVCGKPTAITYNVWTIVRYDNKPAGSVMQVCSGPVMPGWTVVSTSWNPTACGRPTSMTDNIMTIRRIQ